jgi:hypothetical protein
MPIATRGDGVSLPEQNRVIVSTSVDVLDDDGFNVGFIQQLNRNDTRQILRVRHLDIGDAGRVLELSPGPEDNTLNATGFALYARGADPGAVINRIAGLNGQAFKSLNSNAIPFEVVEVYEHPATHATGETTYGDNLINNYSRPVNIGAVQIVESCAMITSWVEPGQVGIPGSVG